MHKIVIFIRSNFAKICLIKTMILSRLSSFSHFDLPNVLDRSISSE